MASPCGSSKGLGFALAVLEMVVTSTVSREHMGGESCRFAVADGNIACRAHATYPIMRT